MDGWDRDRIMAMTNDNDTLNRRKQTNTKIWETQVYIREDGCMNTPALPLQNPSSHHPTLPYLSVLAFSHWREGGKRGTTLFTSCFLIFLLLLPEADCVFYRHHEFLREGVVVFVFGQVEAVEAGGYYY